MGNPDGESILWVEDDANQRRIIEEFFGLLGFKAALAANGSAALEILERETYDVLITDIGMPEMNGWQLIEIVRAKYGTAMRIVIVSGWAQEIDQDTRIKYGVDSIISKPFRISELRQVLSGNAGGASTQAIPLDPAPKKMPGAYVRPAEKWNVNRE